MKKQEKLAVIICNLNKGSTVTDCIQSVLSSIGFDIGSNLKIFVVGNASDETSLQNIQQQYGNQVSLVLSNTDLEGCCAVNLGIKHALAEHFPYICCLGAEITVAPQALKIMFDFITATPNVGLVGGKVYHKHMPHYVQQFGISIDFKHFRASTHFADTLDNGGMPNFVYCDAIGSCGMMISAQAIEKVGLLPEENFLYWDDMEWGYKIKMAGYEVVAVGAANLYHSANPMHRYNNTKVNYYMTRNCLRFFMNYTRPEHCAKMSLVLLRSIFEEYYLHKMGHAHNMAQSDMAALYDAIYGIQGKAPDNRILVNDESGLGFVNFFEEHEAVYMEEDDPFLEQIIRQINPYLIFMQLPEPNAVTIVRCESILKIKDFTFSLDFSDNVVYIDKKLRMLATREDMDQIKDYESILQAFLFATQPMVLRRISEIRGIEF